MMGQQRAVPNFATATRITDTKMSTVVAVSSTNPELATALASLDGYTLAEQRLAKLADAFKKWQEMTVKAVAASDAETAIRAAIDDDSLDALPANLAKESHRADVLHAALLAACTTASSLRGDQVRLISTGTDTILAALDTRLRNVVTELTEHTQTLRGITTAEEAIEAGVADEWSSRKSAHETVETIRAAQSVILRNLASDLYQWLTEDDRRALAIAEVDNWRAVEKRLPQIIRHGGIWAKDRHKGREEERVERWSVPWPQGQAARTAWLLENHPDQLRVPTLQAMEDARQDLQQLTAQATPTGGRAEPASLITAEPLNKRSLR